MAPNPPEGAELNVNGEEAADGAVGDKESFNTRTELKVSLVLNRYCLMLESLNSVNQYRPEDEGAEGAAAPKPKDGAAAAAGAAALAEAPKMNG